MGFIKDLGKIAGSVAGMAIGAPISLAGELVNSDMLKEIGDGVYRVSGRTGELLGNVTEGAAETVYGTLTSDRAMQSQGLNKVVDSGTTYAKGIVKGTVKMAGNAVETVDAIASGDTDRAIRVGKELVKTAAVATLAVGVADVLDGLDILDDADDILADNDDLLVDNDDFIENPNFHHVTPHWRTLPDGREIWVDGDGNTSIDTFDGWIQSNPDYKA